MGRQLFREYQFAVSDWEYHKFHCSKCALVDFKHTATLAHACLHGSELLKRAAQVAKGKLNSLYGKRGN